MKKYYSKPEVEVLEVELQNILAGTQPTYDPNDPTQQPVPINPFNPGA